MKNPKPTFFLIEKSIFPFDVLVCLSTYDELVNYIEKKKEYKLDDNERNKLWMEHGDAAKTITLSSGQTIIRLKRKKTSLGFDLVDLTHEIEHASFFIMNRIGVKHTLDSDEMFAYYQAYLMKECLNYFDK